MKFIKILKNTDFYSSTTETEQFRSFFNQAKKDLKSILKPYIKEFKLEANHFDFSGFFKLTDNRIYYISISDVRYFKDERILIRTAKSFTDYTGGSNCYISLDNNFKDSLLNFIGTTKNSKTDIPVVEYDPRYKNQKILQDNCRLKTTGYYYNTFNQVYKQVKVIGHFDLNQIKDFNNWSNTHKIGYEYFIQV